MTGAFISIFPNQSKAPQGSKLWSLLATDATLVCKSLPYYLPLLYFCTSVHLSFCNYMNKNFANKIKVQRRWIDLYLREVLEIIILLFTFRTYCIILYTCIYPSVIIWMIILTFWKYSAGDCMDLYLRGVVSSFPGSRCYGCCHLWHDTSGGNTVWITFRTKHPTNSRCRGYYTHSRTCRKCKLVRQITTRA